MVASPSFALFRHGLGRETAGSACKENRLSEGVFIALLAREYETEAHMENEMSKTGRTMRSGWHSREKPVEEKAGKVPNRK